MYRTPEWKSGPEGPLLQRAAALERSSEGHLISVVQVASDGEAVREPRDLHPDRCEQAREIQSRGLPFRVGIGRDNDLARVFFADSIDQFFDLQLADTNALDGRDETAKHVVAPTIAHRPLDRVHIFCFTDHAEQGRIASRIAADAARIGFGERKAPAAESHLLFDVQNCAAERFGIFLRSRKQIER